MRRSVLPLVGCLLAWACSAPAYQRREAAAPGSDGSVPSGLRQVVVTPKPLPVVKAVRTFHRPTRCGNGRWTSHKRRVVECAAEERLELAFLDDGTQVVRVLDEAAARNPYPEELARAWRFCPGQPDSLLERDPHRFTAYQDPDVPPCYLLRDAGGHGARVPPGTQGLDLLIGVHPFVADAVARVIATAAGEGIQLKVISGVRSHTVKTKTSVRTVKQGGKPVKQKVKQTVHAPTLHRYGLAVDVNLAGHPDLGSAASAYRKDPAERARWQRVGELAEEAGLTWLGHGDVNEIFHVEWHPGWPGLPDAALGARLDKLKQARGNQAVWELLAYDPRRPALFPDILDAPAPLAGQ
jgi:hypothetical protein